MSADTPQPEMASPNPLASPPGSIALEAPQPTKGGIFSYVNPFDQLHQSSPLNRTPQPQAQGKKIEILKHDRAASDNLNGESGAPAAKTRKLSSPNKKPTSQTVEAIKSPQSVSKKLEGISGQVHNEVAQALATATKDETSAKANEVAIPVAEKQASDATVDTDWSTAEDEDAKQEEDAKVEVFNFPMKPFVTLQLQSSRAARPFRPSTWESATPIARLKKSSRMTIALWPRPRRATSSMQLYRTRRSQTLVLKSSARRMARTSTCGQRLVSVFAMFRYHLSLKAMLSLCLPLE